MLKFILISIILTQVVLAEGKKELSKGVVVSVSGSVKFSNVIKATQTFSLKAALRICGGLSDDASKNKIDVFRFKMNGEYEVKRLEIPRDFQFKLKNGDMVIVRHNVYWSSAREETQRMQSILAEELQKKANPPNSLDKKQTAAPKPQEQKK